MKTQEINNVESQEGFCVDKIRPRKIKSQNVIHRLRSRETYGNKASHLKFYQCIVPNLTVSLKLKSRILDS